MRAGELCSLRWVDVFDTHCKIQVMVKTKASRRDVPLSDKTRRTIEMMRGWDEDLVFGIKPATLDALFRKYRAAAGLSGFTFHDSRHTAATWIGLSGKWNVLEMCKAFGWKNPKQAMVYFNPKADDLSSKLNARPPSGLQ
jgi:integrase